VGLNITPSIGGSEGMIRCGPTRLRFLIFLTTTKCWNATSAKLGIGQFVLASGSLSIVDISILKVLFAISTLKNRIVTSQTDIEKSPRAERRTQNRQADILSKSEIEVGLELIASFNSDCTIYFRNRR
jgi:hypothetical protein